MCDMSVLRLKNPFTRGEGNSLTMAGYCAFPYKGYTKSKLINLPLLQCVQANLEYMLGYEVKQEND